MSGETRYGIEVLADLGGVTRRTVRFYVQEGLIPAPYGVGRGDHYGPEHLDALLRVKALQESGRSLDEIRRTRGAARSPRDTASIPALSRPPGTITAPAAAERWRRVQLIPGVELHLAEDVVLPDASSLQRLVNCCRTVLRQRNEDGNAQD